MLTDPDWGLLHAFGARHKKDGSLLKRITFVVGKNGKVKLAYWYDGRGDVTSHMHEALKAVKG